MAEEIQATGKQEGSLTIKKAAPVTTSNQDKGTQEKPNTQVSEEKKSETPRGMRKFSNDGSDVYKVELKKPPTEEEEKQAETKNELEVIEEPKESEDLIELVEETTEEKGVDEVEQTKSETREDGKSEEKTTIEDYAKSVTQKAEEPNKEEIELPEDVKAFMEFKNKTGGSLEDYVNLNRDFTKMNPESLIKEYLKEKKPHFDAEDISLYMETNFSYDEELDDDKEVKQKKLAYKDLVNEAIQHFEGLKENYYKAAESGSTKLTPEIKEALDFKQQFELQQEKEAMEQSQKRKQFIDATKNLFNEEFKGFEFKVDGKKYVRKINDAKSVMESQSNLENVFSKYFDEKSGALKDASGYHKALYAAQNPDKLAEQFYQQGKADAIKSQEKTAKNIQMDGRKSTPEYVEVGKTRVRVVPDGEFASSSKLKIRKTI